MNKKRFLSLCITFINNGKTHKVNKNDERYLSGELKGITTGKIVVRDKDGNTFNIDKDNPRYLSGELKGVTSGRVLVKDLNNNVFWVDNDDERLLCGVLLKATKKELNESKSKIVE